MKASPSIDLDELLEHASWARQLAQSLVGESAADDLLQETWLAALRNTPSGDRPLRPWLATVLSNLARKRARGQGRRREREQIGSRPEALPSAATLTERAESQRLLIDALLELDPEMRQLVLLRFFEGHSASQIARLQGVPATTVRSRLERGLAQLRGILDGRQGGDRESWSLALLPLLRIKTPAATLGMKAAATLFLMKSISAPVAVLVVITSCVLGFLVMGPFRSAPDEATPTAAPSELALTPNLSSEDESALPELPLEVGSANSRRAQNAEPAPSEPTAEATIAFTPWPAKGVDMELILAPSGAPASGAVVRHLVGGMGVGGPRYVVQSLILGRDELSPLDTKGAAVYQADALGHVRLPDIAGESLVVCELGDARAYTTLGGSLDLGPRLELHEPRSITLRVEDKAGTPAEGLRLELSDLPGGMLGRQMPTDPRGELVLHNTDLLLALARQAGGASIETTLDVTAKLMFMEPLQVQVDLADPPSETVRFVLPVRGLVEVSVVNQAGQSLADAGLPIRFDVTFQGQSASGAAWPKGGELATLRGTPIGAVVRAALSKFTEAKPLAPVTGTVPANGVLELTLVVDSNPPARVTARLLAETGEPLANLEALAAIRQEKKGGTGSASTRITTDAEGRFELPLDTSLEGRGGANMSTVFFFSLTTPEGQKLCGQEFTRPGVLEPLIDLGDVICGPIPMLAAGRVVDPLGNPIAGILVHVEELPKSMPGMAKAAPWGKRVANQQSSPTDEEGHFEIVGITKKRDLQLGIQTQGLNVPKRPTFTTGARDLEMVVSKLGSLMGSLHFDNPEDSKGWTVAIHPQDKALYGIFNPRSILGWGSATTDWSQNRLAGNGGDFGWSDLPPGLYDVRVGLPGGDGFIRTWKDIEVLPGMVTRDPRLQDVDLAGQLQHAMLTVVDPAGEPIGNAGWAEARDKRAHQLTMLSDGKGEVPFSKATTHLWVAAPGYLAQNLTAQPGAIRVVLEPSPEVVLVLPPGLTLPQNATLRAELEADDGPSFRPGTLMDFPGGDFVDGEATVQPFTQGKQRVKLRLTVQSAGGSRSRFGPVPKEVEPLLVDASSQGARFQLLITQEILDSFLP